MANTFVWILFIATLVTGVFWCLEKVKFAPARRAKVATAKAQSKAELSENDLAKIAKQPSWLETVVSIFPVLALVFMVRSFIYEPFQIPSGSMMPTLLIGDFILVEKFAYGIKNPLTQNTLIATDHPKRGDIVVFKYPRNEQLDYIKRVVGLPGDKVVYNPSTKQVSVYPTCASEQTCSALAVTYDAGAPSDFVMENGGFYTKPQDEKAGLRLWDIQETLGEVTHHILNNPEQLTGFGFQQSGQNLGTFIVPEGHYFMMGDNRDNSADSRFWGFVPEKNLVGKATAIWMSFEKQENEWPTGVRLSRIGGIH